MLLILSHGQATVESGFSVNGKCLLENFHTESLIAQRHTHDHMRSYDLEAHDLDITCEYWILSVLQENIISRARKRDHWQRKSLLKIVSWLNRMKRF